VEIGDWRATQGLNEVMREARELGLERNLLELDTYGFTVVEPYKAASKQEFDALRDAVYDLIANEDPTAVDINRQPEATRPAYGRQLFHLLVKDDRFARAVMNRYTLTFARFMMGATCRLYSTVAFFKTGTVGSTHLHSDSTGMPPPLPYFGNVCNVSWVLTDYTVENGTFYMVPGSRHFCRHPSDVDQPTFMGGPAAEDFGVAVNAPAGSLIVFHGNTWHGTYPKTSEGPRVHVANAFCRNYVNPAESYDDVPPEMLEKYGTEMRRLLGFEAWQGYRTEGPKLPRMAQVRGANWNQYF
jgi:ectoine hydroxylase-related dioxygenase (phytanoyl-CoA dioxygenase family)